LTIRFKINHLDPALQQAASLNAQLNMAGYDTLGVCIFAGSGYAATPDAVIKRLLEARYGWDDVPENILQELGKQTIRMEREFNRRAGFTAKDDRLPAWMTREPLSPHNSVFDVPEEALDDIFKGIE
jgi:aldehyde:ferredoxin oxidoreductase